jgi:Mrp family chromosome partitioning ATPase
MDLDLCGPSIPRMMGIEGFYINISQNFIKYIIFHYYSS